jgi:hypothetical protein
MRVKHIVLGLAFLAVFAFGAALGAFGASRAFTRDLETNMSVDLENAFLRVAKPDGTPRSPDMIVRNAENNLAMTTINTGKLYPEFRREGSRDAVVMYFKRIDANRAGLQPGNDQWTAEADRVRACVIKFANDNKGATECLNSCSRINYEIVDAQTGKITRSVPCKP